MGPEISDSTGIHGMWGFQPASGHPIVMGTCQPGCAASWAQRGVARIPVLERGRSGTPRAAPNLMRELPLAAAVPVRLVFGAWLTGEDGESEGDR